MRAADTKVVIRYLTGDDPAQAAKVRRIIGVEPVFLPRTVVLEVEWVLRSLYGFKAERVVVALRALCGLPAIQVEDAPMVARALHWAEAGMDFADALHLSACSACTSFVTFDQRLAGKRGIVPVELL